MPKPATDPYRLVLERLLGSRIVGYHPELARVVGGVKTAVYLSQLLYLDGRQDARGSWFEVSQDLLANQTGLSPKEQRSARTELAALRLLDTKRIGMPAHLSYRVHVDQLVAIAAGQLSLLPDMPDGNIKMCPTGISRSAESAHHDVPDGNIPSKNRDSKSRASAKSGGATRPPAVELYRRLVNRYPAKALWPRIDRIVGKSFAGLLHWGRVIREWSLAGYNVTNLRGILEVYEKGWRPAGGNGRPGNARQGYDPAADMAAFKDKRGLK